MPILSPLRRFQVNTIGQNLPTRLSNLARILCAGHMPKMVMTPELVLTPVGSMTSPQLLTILSRLS